LRPTDAAAHADLTPTRVTVLLHIARSGPMKLSHLADEEGLNPTMLSRIIGKLCDDGLVTRSSDTGDRRAAWVEATSKGQRLAERIRQQRTDALNAALDNLTDAEQHQIEQALPAFERLAEALRRNQNR
jgi:DNA-binding MarR family transcriptional regulator